MVVTGTGTFADDNYTTTYQYDLNNRLLSEIKTATTGRQEFSNYTYDAWDGANIVADLNGNGAVVQKYIRSFSLIRREYNDGNTAQSGTATSEWYLFNARADVVQLTNNQGVIIRIYCFDAC
jgi:hypothetical protein